MKIDPPTIEETGGMTLVGLHTPFIHALSKDANAMQTIGPLWERLLQRRAEISAAPDAAMYGVITGPPESERTHPDELHYLAGIEVVPRVGVPEGMAIRRVPLATYARFRHRGPIDRLPQTLGQIFGEWLKTSAWRHSGQADVEVYDERFDPAGEDSVMEYWISIEPR